MFPHDDDTVNDDESVNDDQTRRTPPRCFEVACLRGLDDARLLAAALIRPAPGEGILGRYVEMPFIVTLPHARGRGLWRELTRELIAWTVRRAAWRATALIVKVKRGGGGGGGGVKRKRDKERGDRHWQETMWRDGAGAVRVDGGGGGTLLSTVEGGNHRGFGSYEVVWELRPDGNATLSRHEQQAQTLDYLALAGLLPGPPAATG